MPWKSSQLAIRWCKKWMDESSSSYVFTIHCIVILFFDRTLFFISTRVCHHCQLIGCLQWSWTFFGPILSCLSHSYPYLQPLSILAPKLITILAQTNINYPCPPPPHPPTHSFQLLMRSTPTHPTHPTTKVLGK